MDRFDEKLAEAKQNYLSQKYPGDLGELTTSDAAKSDVIANRPRMSTGQNRKSYNKWIVVSIVAMVAASILIIVNYPVDQTTISSAIPPVENASAPAENTSTIKMKQNGNRTNVRPIKQPIGLWSFQTVHFNPKYYSLLGNAKKGPTSINNRLTLTRIGLIKKQPHLEKIRHRYSLTTFPRIKSRWSKSIKNRTHSSLINTSSNSVSHNKNRDSKGYHLESTKLRPTSKLQNSQRSLLVNLKSNYSLSFDSTQKKINRSMTLSFNN